MKIKVYFNMNIQNQKLDHRILKKFCDLKP